jgi:HPt (histidine-containing phosphotransfer) domain-containing protein
MADRSHPVDPALSPTPEGDGVQNLAERALLALGALRRVLEREAPVVDPSAALALQALRAEAEGFLALSNPPSTTKPTLPDDTPAMDLAAFARLLDMAGPEAAAELTERFRDDLHSTATALTAAIDEMSWDNLRGATHILIALAGTAGADDLHRRALALNAVAKKKDPEAVNHQAPALLAQLRVLLAFFDAKAET